MTRRDRIGRALEPHRLVSKCREHLLVVQQPFSLALDDKNGLAVTERQYCRVGTFDAAGLRRGKPYLEAAALRRFAVHVHPAVMVTNDLVHGCQSQSGP